MNKTHLYTILLVIIANYSLIGQNKLQSKILNSRIDNYLNAGAKNGFSGAIAVIKKGNIIINKGYGEANRNIKTLNNPNTIFDIGSNTKQFTATAILKLAELGKLKLTDSLSTFFNRIPEDKQSITIHQLLSHSAGFVDAIGKDFAEISQEDFFQQLFATKLLSKPGEKYSYSNTGYSILGRIIELVSNQPYEAFINEYLFAPAGMKQTGYLLPNWDSKNIAWSYNRGILESESPIFKYQKYNDITWHLKANGGINSSQNDLVLWYKALKSYKILNEESLKKLTTSHIHFTSAKFEYGYAYGWTVRMLENNIKRLTHNGSNGAYSHSLVWFPEYDIFISYATNANSSQVEFIAYEVAKIVLDKNYSPGPIKNNLYAYAINFIREHSTDKSTELIALLQKNYADDFTNSRPLNSIGNILLMINENNEWAIELFKKNIQLYPNDGNLWDSLGDGYKANNQEEEAIKSYKKAVELGYKDSQVKLTELIKN
ncbi:serine hydrolase [Maribacter sp. PR1]|uniref:Serine hydrolase n=1 Tax=Maribacter cobaltidurans TaxID=1178778 RepID=A0ABU7ITU4_9FLAO|nr:MULTISPECIES: serine hydrolase [Maribacter]MDC6388557.1 serine hydrolase [Maribacter sp. PR1]MEE1975946.1 serine hydrolase [Maribacter cobaltidurans]